MLELKNRATRQVMPKVYTVDMREELKNGNRSILSDRLTELMEKCLSGHHQMMLFLNRRGYAGFVSCRSCGYVVNVLIVMFRSQSTEEAGSSVITVGHEERDDQNLSVLWFTLYWWIPHGNAAGRGFGKEALSTGKSPAYGSGYDKE